MESKFSWPDLFRKLAYLTSGIFLVISVVAFIIFAVLGFYVHDKFNTWPETEGEIVDFLDDSEQTLAMNDSDNSRWPIISYEVDGTRREFTGNYYLSSMHKGDKLTILYDSDNPLMVIIKDLLILGLTVVGAFATAFLFLAIVFFAVARIIKRKFSQKPENPKGCGGILP